MKYLLLGPPFIYPAMILAIGPTKHLFLEYILCIKHYTSDSWQGKSLRKPTVMAPNFLYHLMFIPLCSLPPQWIGACQCDWSRMVEVMCDFQGSIQCRFVSHVSEQPQKWTSQPYLNLQVTAVPVTYSCNLMRESNTPPSHPLFCPPPKKKQTQKHIER